MLPDVCVTTKKSQSQCGIPIITVPTEGGQNFGLILKDGYCRDDAPVDLASVDRIVFMAKETLNAVNSYIEKECSVVDAEEGVVTFSLSAADLPFAGVYQAGVVIYDGAGGITRPSKFWLNVEKSITHDLSSNTPLSIMEIRSFLYDKCPEDNYLLDDLENCDSDVAAAISWAVHEWNETPPDLIRYTTATFPYRRHWLLGASAHLLKSLAYNHARNNLSYNAGGVSVNDRDKAAVYRELGRDLESEWKTWMMNKKVEININACYGGVGSEEFF